MVELFCDTKAWFLQHQHPSYMDLNILYPNIAKVKMRSFGDYIQINSDAVRQIQRKPCMDVYRLTMLNNLTTFRIGKILCEMYFEPTACDIITKVGLPTTMYVQVNDNAFSVDRTENGKNIDLITQATLPYEWSEQVCM